MKTQIYPFIEARWVTSKTGTNARLQLSARIYFTKNLERVSSFLATLFTLSVGKKHQPRQFFFGGEGSGFALIRESVEKGLVVPTVLASFRPDEFIFPTEDGGFIVGGVKIMVSPQDRYPLVLQHMSKKDMEAHKAYTEVLRADPCVDRFTAAVQTGFYDEIPGFVGPLGVCAD